MWGLNSIAVTASLAAISTSCAARTCCGGAGMVAPESPGDTIASRDGSSTRKAAVLLALRYYGRELSRHRRVALPGLLLPALGNISLLSTSLR